MIDPDVYALRIATMIREDIFEGILPDDTCSWPEIEDYVDAIDYFRAARVPFNDEVVLTVRTLVSKTLGWTEE